VDGIGYCLETTLKLTVLVSTTDVVEHHQERLQHAGLALGAYEFTIPVDASLVVDVLGLESLQIGRAFGELLLKAGWFGLGRGIDRLNRRLAGRACRLTLLGD